MVASKIKEVVVHTVHEGKMEEYLMGKYGWSKHLFQAIDWVAHGKAFESLPATTQFSVSKSINKWRSTMARCHKFSPIEYPSNVCLICKEVEEDNDHV